jgi:hypothetical protein
VQARLGGEIGPLTGVIFEPRIGGRDHDEIVSKPEGVLFDICRIYGSAKSLCFEVCGVQTCDSGARACCWVGWCIARMVGLEASQASARSQLSNACLPVESRYLWREIWLFLCDLLQHSHGNSTMPPSCARRAPTDSNASLVHYYGLPTAWGAPACLHAAACADQNSVTLSPQLADRSTSAPQLLDSGVSMAMG